MLRSLLVVFCLFPFVAHAFPEDRTNRIAPGCLCTTNDPDFDGLRYPEQIPHCKRNVTARRKDIVKQIFGVPQDQWKFYQVDHRIALWLGGSNADCNLVPITGSQHENKNILEYEIRTQIEDGQVLQKEAINKIQQWYHDCFFGDQCP